MLTQSYQCRLLTDRDVRGQSPIARRAAALALAANPSVTEEQWVLFTRRCLLPPRRSSGIAALENRRGYLLAIYRYHVDMTPPLVIVGSGVRRTLRLQDLIVADLPGPSLLGQVALCSHALAISLDCAAIALELPVAMIGIPGSTATQLRHAGFSAGTGASWVKLISADAASPREDGQPVDFAS